jgi:hypothetical protein
MKNALYFDGLPSSSAARQLYHSQTLHIEAKDPTLETVQVAETDLQVCAIVPGGQGAIFQLPPAADLAAALLARPTGNTVCVLHKTTL